MGICDWSAFMENHGGVSTWWTAGASTDTDITRTFHYDLPTEDMVTRYTEVLAGAIDLASLVLPDKKDKLGNFHTKVFFSDELGYYQEVDWGLRLEQTLRITPTETSSESRPEQIEWYNEYNSLIIGRKWVRGN